MFDLIKWLEDAPIRLVSGAGNPNTGGCWMTALAYYSGADWSDHPPCVDFESGLGALCIHLNDMLPSDEARGRVIGPHILEPVGTATDDKNILEQRRWVLIDAAMRRLAPYALRKAGLEEHAEELERLPKVTPTNVRDASRAAHAADSAAHAAADSATRATRAAARAAHATRAAAHAADSAAHAAAHAAAAHAADATRAAARAADSATRAAAHSAYADDSAAACEAFAREIVMPVILEMCSIGSKTPVEPQCGVDDFKPVVQCV